jgi:DNA polymerase III delta prime subunit
MKIIGISGHKGSGKTTAAECLERETFQRGSSIKGSYIIGFADAIKESYCDMFGLESVEPRDLNQQDVKNCEHLCGKTHRQMLQEYGCAMRAIWDDVWVEAWRKLIRFGDQSDDLIIIPDVRFPNEVRAIHDIDGHVIRLTRTPFPEDKHESETALDNWTNFNAIIDNSNMSIDEQDKAVLELVTERGWV